MQCIIHNNRTNVDAQKCSLWIHAQLHYRTQGIAIIQETCSSLHCFLSHLHTKHISTIRCIFDFRPIKSQIFMQSKIMVKCTSKGLLPDHTYAKNGETSETNSLYGLRPS